MGAMKTVTSGLVAGLMIVGGAAFVANDSPTAHATGSEANGVIELTDEQLDEVVRRMLDEGLDISGLSDSDLERYGAIYASDLATDTDTETDTTAARTEPTDQPSPTSSPDPKHQSAKAEKSKPDADPKDKVEQKNAEAEPDQTKSDATKGSKDDGAQGDDTEGDAKTKDDDGADDRDVPTFACDESDPAFWQSRRGAEAIFKRYAIEIGTDHETSTDRLDRLGFEVCMGMRPLTGPAPSVEHSVIRIRERRAAAAVVPCTATDPNWVTIRSQVNDLFASYGVPVASETETAGQRLDRIANDVCHGVRPLRDDNSGIRSVESSIAGLAEK